MNNAENEKTFNHSKASIADKIALVAELEHGRRHALRAAASAWREDDDSDSMQYLIWAKRFQEIRRDYMRKYFGDLKETDWCLFKVCATLRQLTYEVCEGDLEELKEIDDFVDEILGKALGMDMSDCVACREDRQSGQGPSEVAERPLGSIPPSSN